MKKKTIRNICLCIIMILLIHEITSLNVIAEEIIVTENNEKLILKQEEIKDEVEDGVKELDSESDMIEEESTVEPVQGRNQLSKLKEDGGDKKHDTPDSIAEKKEEQGRVTLSIQFEAEEFEDAKEWINNAKKSGEEWINLALSQTTDSDKIKLLNEALDISHQIVTDEFFHIDENKNVIMEVPVANAVLEFDDGTRTTTDEEGCYSIENLPQGEHEITITKAGTLNINETIEVQEKMLNGDISVCRTSEEIKRRHLKRRLME